VTEDRSSHGDVRALAAGGVTGQPVERLDAHLKHNAAGGSQTTTTPGLTPRDGEPALPDRAGNDRPSPAGDDNSKPAAAPAAMLPRDGPARSASPFLDDAATSLDPFGPVRSPESQIRDVLYRRSSRVGAVTAIHFVILQVLSLADVHVLVSPSYVGWWMKAIDFLATATLVGCMALLWIRPSLPLGALRRIEMLIFGMIAFDFTALQYTYLVAPLPGGYEGPRHAATHLASVNFLVDFYWFCLIVIYGLVIVNTTRRTAWMVGGMTALSLGALVAAALQNEAVRPLLPMLLATSATLLAIANALAIFGSFKIGELQRAAIEARKLGQYRLVRLLGTGGMGEVHLAEHAMLKRPCAIKLIRPDRSREPGLLRRFEREVRVMSRLTHPNIVEVYDFGLTPGGAFYYVMEYLPGLTLGELVSGHGPPPPGRVIYLVRQVCQALDEAHGAGLVHRDIKPGNVIVGRYGGRSDVVKLLDFGLVRSLSQAHETHLTGEGQVLGTPDYISPEQAGGAAGAGPQSDLYSLGSLTYYLITGQPPFVRSTVAEAIVAHLREPPQPPSMHAPDVPPDLEAVVLRCLAKDPPERFRDARHLDDALAGCSCAGEWDQERARSWWASIAPT
jgi:eukaryotic-like serine/threonine-protein kinase